MTALFTDDLTTSVEDYLKAIYAITRQGHPASTSEIARWLDLSPPSVSGMIKRLSQQGLLEYQPYKGVELTAKGRRAALTVLRRHRIIESYLVERLGYSWDSVHQEAERLEHAVSDVLIERMAATAILFPHQTAPWRRHRLPRCRISTWVRKLRCVGCAAMMPSN
jgi:DtxR family Mn-dependent transcriptional regulator